MIWNCELENRTRIQESMESFVPEMKKSKVELIEELGNGAYGSVHVGKRSDGGGGGEMAVKVIKHTKIAFDGELTQQVIDLRKIKRELLILT